VSISVNAGSYVDAAGNAGTGATLTTLSIDTQAPSLAITSNFESLKTGETATITFRFSEAPINFDENDVVVSGGELSTPIASESDPKIYTATFTPTAGSESTASISVGAGTYVDAAGNAGTAATLTTLSIDTQAPSLAITSNFESLKAGETATITFRFSEAPINFDENDVAVSGGELSTPIASESDPKIYTGTFTPTTNSEISVSISVNAGSYGDAAGNAGVGVSLSLAIDTAVPNTPSLILNQDTGVSATDHITSDTTLLIQNLEIGARWEYRFGASSSWIVGGVAQTSESRINLAANQVYAIGAIHVRQTDTVGNISAIGQNSRVLQIDNAAPEIIDVSIISSGPYAVGEFIEVSVTFDSTIFVDTRSGRPEIYLDLGFGNFVPATYREFLGPNTLIFEYASSSPINSGFSVRANSFDLGGAVIVDVAGHSVQANHGIAVEAFFELREGATSYLTVNTLGVSHYSNAALIKTNNSSGGVFYKNGLVIEQFTVADLQSFSVYFVDDGDERAPQFELSIVDGAQSEQQISPAINYIPVNDAPLLPSNDHHINLRDAESVLLTENMLGVIDLDTDARRVTFGVSSILGLEVLRSNVAVTAFTLTDVQNGIITLNRLSEVAPLLQLSVNDGDSDDQILDLQFNELGLLSEITLSTTLLDNGRSQIEISGLLDPDFAPHSTLQVSTNGGETWQTIDVTPELTRVGRLDYQDARWANENFNYAGSWAGTGFGLSGTQRGAPENISIGEIEGRTALTYTSGVRDAAWYAANPGASTANVYKNQDAEAQDDFYWYQPYWQASDNPYFSARIYKPAGNVLAFRIPVLHADFDGTGEFRSYPAIWIYDGQVALRAGGRYDIWLEADTPTEYVGWLTAGLHVSSDGDLHYFLATEHVDNVFTSEHLITTNKKITGEIPGYGYDFFPIIGRNDATVMVSNIINNGPNAIQDLSYSKQLNDASWSITDTQEYASDAQLDYSFRIVDVNGNAQEQLNYDSVNVQNLHDNGDIVLTNNTSLYRDVDALPESALASTPVAASSRAEVNMISGENLVGTEGDDVLAISDLSFTTLNGGLGTDSLRFEAALTVDFRNLADEVITSIEVIDLTNDGGDSTLVFNVSDVLNFSEATDELVIRGEAGDTVYLDNVAEGYAGAWVSVGSFATATIYSYVDTEQGLASVVIDDAIAVNILG
jgi:hypothetical protein